MTVEEYIATMNEFMRTDHEALIAEIRGWAEEAEAKGWAASARQHREHVARLEAMEKPWEKRAAA